MDNKDEKKNKEIQCNLNISSKINLINNDKSVYFSRILFFYKYKLIKKKINDQVNSDFIQEKILRLNNSNLNNDNKDQLNLYVQDVEKNKNENTLFQKILSKYKKKNNLKKKILNSQIIHSKKDIDISNNIMKESKFPLINLSNNSYIINDYSNKTYINLYKENNQIIFNPLTNYKYKKNNKKKHNIFPKMINSKSTIEIHKNILNFSNVKM